MYKPRCTKNTESQTRILSEEGTIYMPSGQCSLCRKEAYSRETAVRVTGFVVVSTGGVLLGT